MLFHFFIILFTNVCLLNLNVCMTTVRFLIYFLKIWSNFIAKLENKIYMPEYNILDNTPNQNLISTCLRAALVFQTPTLILRPQLILNLNEQSKLYLSNNKIILVIVCPLPIILVTFIITGKQAINDHIKPIAEKAGQYKRPTVAWSFIQL